MKIVFLDFDGVCNSWRTQHKAPWKDERMLFMRKLDPDHVAILNEVVRQTDAKVVVSSTWRKGRTVDGLQEVLNDAGFIGHVIDKTGELWGEIPGGNGERFQRGHEIQEWIDNNPFLDCRSCSLRDQHLCGPCKGTGQIPLLESFVILDDDSDMAHLKSRLVQTCMEFGLLWTDLPKILAKLNEPVEETK